MAEISKHGFVRSKERVGLGKKATINLARKALTRGLGQNDVTGSLKNYFSFLFFAHKKGNNIRIYAEKVFIFDDEFLITVFNIPNEHKILARRALEKKNGKN